MAHAGVHVRQADRGKSLAEYWPLICLVAVSALAGLAIGVSGGEFDMLLFMHAFLGVFLLVFALLKLFDLRGFRNGFAIYDLIARRQSAYGYVYPFIELGLALAYLSFAAPEVTYLITIVVFTFSAVGV